MTGLGSIERVRRALHFGRPDRIPLVFRSEAERSDIITTGYGAPAEWRPSERSADEWGTHWGNIIGTGCGQIVREPLAASADLSGFTFPDPHAAGRFSSMAATVARFPGRYIAASLGLSATCTWSALLPSG